MAKDAANVKPRKRSKKIATSVPKDTDVNVSVPKKRTPVKSPAKTETIVIDGDESDGSGTKKPVKSFFAVEPIATEPSAAVPKENPDFLSPVSKLHRAQEIAAKEQEERIKAAVDKRANEARQRAAKRKEMATKAETGTLSKVAKTNSVDAADTDDIVEPSATVTVKAATHTIGSTSIVAEKRMKPVQNEGESGTAYALRAAHLAKEERKKIAATKATIPEPVAAPEVSPEEPVPEASPTVPVEVSAVPTPSTDDIYETPEFVVRNAPVEAYRSVSAPTFPDVMHVVPEALAPVEPTTALVRSVPARKAPSGPRVWAYTGVLVAAAAAVLLEPVLNCRACPPQGVCTDGALVDCAETFVALDGECKEAAVVPRDSALMAVMLQDVWRGEASSVFCAAPIAERLAAVDPLRVVQELHLPSSVAVSTEALRQHLRQDSVWKSVGPKNFNLAFTKALKRLGKDADAAAIDLSIADASLVCQATTFALQYFTSVVLVLLIIVLAVYVVLDNQQAAADEEMLLHMFSVVQEELITYSETHTDDADRGYPIHYLRDHVADIMQLTPAQKHRHVTTLWNRLRLVVQGDARIDERVVTRGPNDATVVVWEWIGAKQAEPSA
ncbi:hypothetical protein ACHHYP_02208 [Achlya hypogyna]|uniref:Man1/Src1-like C-terminal domain-containing protein n=1 Tax=Achlya hypogyna TaxID=1202772 RepID=A0A1V9Z761_ACHHY|nr:hypothetical protein ACHHYP_02208 [Achlya hypogyna]